MASGPTANGGPQGWGGWQIPAHPIPTWFGPAQELRMVFTLISGQGKKKIKRRVVLPDT